MGVGELICGGWGRRDAIDKLGGDEFRVDISSLENRDAAFMDILQSKLSFPVDATALIWCTF